jgi:hypothetical protein
MFYAGNGIATDARSHPPVTVLLDHYLADADAPPPTAIATVASRRRRVQLVLGALSFGFQTPDRTIAAISIGATCSRRRPPAQARLIRV